MSELLAKTPPSSVQLRLSQIISALSLAIDLTKGQAMGQCVNSCLLGMRIAEIVQILSRIAPTFTSRCFLRTHVAAATPRGCSRSSAETI